MSTYEISKSSLLSLKAEILRKESELVKAKVENDIKIKSIKKNSPLEIKNKGIEERKKNDLTAEEEDLLKLSRSTLEAKTKLYERLSNNTNKLSEDEKEQHRRYLVRFEQKNKSKLDEPPPEYNEADVDKYPESDEDRYFSEEYDTSVDPSEEWVEYTDCLGRTRKCLQKDLSYLKSKDADLKKSVDARRNGTERNKESLQPPEENSKERLQEDDKISIDKTSVSDESELISGDMRREMLRKQWEKEEEELTNKTDIHYQNVLFNEARAHGVGYYAFSKDEEERLKQQEALNKLRQETEQQQKRAQELKALREKQLAARIKAAKNRRRARLGLSPEEEVVEEPTTPQEQSKPTEEEQRIQEEQERKHKEEKLLEAARKQHLRPWDVGKEGVKEHYEYSQEEWIEKKRIERPQEFAPPQLYNKREFRSSKSSNEYVEKHNSLRFTTKNLKKTRKRQSSPFKSRSEFANPYKSDFNSKNNFSNNIELSNEEGDSDSDHSVETLSNKEKEGVKYRDYEEIAQSNLMKPIPIIDDSIETDFDDRLLADYTQAMHKAAEEKYSPSCIFENDLDERGKGVEIAPPPTFDYYGPSQSKKSKTIIQTEKITQSIEAGLKFLRQQAEQKKKVKRPP